MCAGQNEPQMNRVKVTPPISVLQLIPFFAAFKRCLKCRPDKCHNDKENPRGRTILTNIYAQFLRSPLFLQSIIFF